MVPKLRSGVPDPVMAVIPWLGWGIAAGAEGEQTLTYQPLNCPSMYWPRQKSRGDAPSPFVST